MRRMFRRVSHWEIVTRVFSLTEIGFAACAGFRRRRLRLNTAADKAKLEADLALVWFDRYAKVDA